MKMNNWVVCAIIMVLLTSCNLFATNRQSTAESETLKVTKTPAGERMTDPANPTPLEPEKQTAQPSTLTQTPDLPTLTLTPKGTDDPNEPTQLPSLTPTKRLVIKPSATQAFLGTQIGSPVAIQNFAHPDLGCGWMGLAGQVFDIDDTPINDLVVEVGGTLEGQPIFGLAITGEKEAYGSGGYEIKLGDEPIESNGAVWAQIYDLEGNAISSPIYFQTYAECGKNLIILNFVQSHTLPSAWFYLPVIYKNVSNP